MNDKFYHKATARNGKVGAMRMTSGNQEDEEFLHVY
jgi:hypothetical protein